MRELNLTVPELGLVAMTRGAAGVGLGLLLAGRLSHEQRRALGWGLFLLGAATTIPLALEVFGKNRPVFERGDREEIEAAAARG